MGSITLLRGLLLSSITLALVSAQCAANDSAHAQETTAPAPPEDREDSHANLETWLPDWISRSASTIPSSHYIHDETSSAAGGLTIAAPAADMAIPGPMSDITISGYVKGDFIFDTKHDLGDYFNYKKLDEGSTHSHSRLHARQTRLRVQSQTDTAIGQVRTLIEGDFFGGTPEDPALQLRHAWGEWEMVPGAVFGAGQYWRNFKSPFTGITTVDYEGPVGLMDKTRNAQLRMTHNSGPMEFAISAEDSGQTNRKSIPDLTGRLQYMLPGGSAFMVSAVTRYYASAPNLALQEQKMGWGMQAAANIDLGGMAVLTASVMYGDGLGNYLLGGGTGAWQKNNGELHLIPALGVFGGLRFNIADNASLNLGVGYVKMDSQLAKNQADSENSVGRVLSTYNKHVTSVHANVLWEPVEQVRLGWEVIWAQRKYLDGGTAAGGGAPATLPAARSASNVRTQFGAWFFF